METLPLAVSDLVLLTPEPRVRDVDLAVRLGFDRPRKIRELIERNLPELESHGRLAPRAGAPITSGKGRVMVVDEYHLNEAQALLVCMFSRTARAATVRAQVIAVYLAWRRGELLRGLPDRHSLELERLRAHHEERGPRFADRIEQRQAALDEFDRQIDEGARVDDAVTAAADMAGVSARTIYDWRLIARGVAGADRPAALTPQYRSRREYKAVHPAALDWLVARLLKPRRGSFSDCYRALLAAAAEKGWSPIPSERSLRRRIEALALVPATGKLLQVH